MSGWMVLVFLFVHHKNILKNTNAGGRASHDTRYSLHQGDGHRTSRRGFQQSKALTAKTARRTNNCLWLLTVLDVVLPLSLVARTVGVQK